MAVLRMSVANAIFTTFLSVSCVIGMTGTAGDYADQAVCSLADVAHMRKFELEICSGNLEWCGEGMKISAYHITMYYWKTKRRLKWALINDAIIVPRDRVLSALRSAFKKWTVVSPFDFDEVTPYELPDIRIHMAPREAGFYARTADPADANGLVGNPVMDRKGVTIDIVDSEVWTDQTNPRWRNLRFAALREVGRALGLGRCHEPNAVMTRCDHVDFTTPGKPELTRDDICGIQRRYGDRNGNYPFGSYEADLEYRRRGEFGI